MQKMQLKMQKVQIKMQKMKKKSNFAKKIREKMCFTYQAMKFDFQPCISFRAKGYTGTMNITFHGLGMKQCEAQTYTQFDYQHLH